MKAKVEISKNACGMSMWDFQKMTAFMTFKKAIKEILKDHIDQDNNGMEKDEPNKEVSMKSIFKTKCCI